MSDIAPVLRVASSDDIPDIAALALASFGNVWHRVLGPKAPDDDKRAVLTKFRSARPAEQHVIAVDEAGQIVGYVSYSCYGPSTTSRWAKLRRQVVAVRPLGWRSMLRYLALRPLTVNYRPAPGEAYLDGIAVAPQFRRNGLGLALTRRVMAESATLGCHRWTVFVVSTNEVSRALLRRLGFAETQVRRTPGRRLAFGEPAIVRAERHGEPP